MVKVSVVVPVYNVEHYIGRCLESLHYQTLEEIEIIVVNDGSPDNSQKIIDEWAKKDKRIRTIIKENGGLSDARNRGIEFATGEYIAFLDSDDYYANDCLSKMYHKAKSIDFDLVVCDVEYIYIDNTVVVSSCIKDDLMTVEAVRNAMVDIYPSACNKLYKSSLLRDIKFKRGIWFEDVEFIHRLLPHITKIGVVNEPLYKYEQRNTGSITSTVDKRIYNYIDNMNGIVEYYKTNNFYIDYFEELEFIYVRYIFATFIRTASRFPKEEYNKAVNIAILNVMTNFPNYKKNKYFKKDKKGLYLKCFNKTLSHIVYLLWHNKKK